MRNDLPKWLVLISTMGAFLMVMLGVYVLISRIIREEDVLEIIDDIVGVFFFLWLFLVGVNDLRSRQKGKKNL
ncbi:MAG: hypothetical protein COB76_02980 [Alphaproteobacteria bacterium]|nr:MAG: hypothetical protein COB76_02980 [Alphaproteobacteria bacterium]